MEIKMKRRPSLKFVLVSASIITTVLISLVISFVGLRYIRKTSNMAYTDFQNSMDFG